MTNKLEQVGNELSSISLDVIEWLKDVVPKSKDFVVDQAPDVIQEIITRAIAMKSLGLLFGLLLLSAIVVTLKIATKERKAREKITPKAWETKEASGFEFSMYAVSVVCGVFGTVITAINLQGLVYILLAPKLYILEYLRRML